MTRAVLAGAMVTGLLEVFRVKRGYTGGDQGVPGCVMSKPPWLVNSQKLDPLPTTVGEGHTDDEDFESARTPATELAVEAVMLTKSAEVSCLSLGI